MSDRTVHLPGTLGGDDSASWYDVDAYIAGLEDASGIEDEIRSRFRCPEDAPANPSRLSPSSDLSGGV
jgi:hypothetical protein